MIDVLEKGKKGSKDISLVEEILAKAKERANSSPSEYIRGLSVEEAAVLLQIDSSSERIVNLLFDTALYIKRAVYGNRMVIFAPLYVSNLCTGGCLYCGFREGNSAIVRKSLNLEELVRETEVLEKNGHKRLLMLMGDHPQYSFENFLEALDVVSKVKSSPHGEIRRINVEIPSLTKEQFKKLKGTNLVGSYVLFQETYHKETYQKMHPSGPKADYEWRLATMDRALESGMDDVGIGVLFGLYDYRFEVISMLLHANRLDKLYGIGPHTISVPRIRPAINTPLSKKVPCPVSDFDFKKLVAVLRCALPYTGIILSTRESPQMRRELYQLGISQISAGSKTDPGGYSNSGSNGQFSIEDNRSLNEVIKELVSLDFIPSFCTACYRLGRTGQAFMHLAKTREIKNCCSKNALLTFAEYLEDYADESLKNMGWQLISKSDKSSDVEKALVRIREKSRDIYF